MSILKEEAAKVFDLQGEVIDIVPFGGGHINDTFLVTTTKSAYILQRVNKFVFKHPEEIIENIQGVTAFLSGKIKAAGGNPLRECINLIPTKDGKFVYVDSEGEFWRSMIFIDNTTAYDAASTPEMLFETGRAFGCFQNMLSDYPAETLHEVIPNFHNTPERVNQLLDAMEKDPSGRAGEVKAEIEFALERKTAAGELMDMLDKGKLKIKVTHNDTKTSNVLIDNTTGKAVSVIDLDTVMPGLTAFDFGDSVRTGASTAPEDETDLTKVNYDTEYFAAYAKGFLGAAGEGLSRDEKYSLVVGSKLMAYEVGIRFLADFINGDVYFKTKYPSHNLDRARNQFKLVRDIESKWDELLSIVGC